jgi:hypothetical protein
MQLFPFHCEADGGHWHWPMVFSYWPPEQCWGVAGLIGLQLWFISLK